MTISELRIRSNNFVANLDTHIKSVVEGVDANGNDALQALNRDQLRNSTLATDQKIIETYSLGYDAYKKKEYPASYGKGEVNLLLTGELYYKMKIEVTGNSYKIDAKVPYVAELKNKYTTDIFGIAPSNQDKAKAITTPLLAMKYKSLVL